MALSNAVCDDVLDITSQQAETQGTPIKITMPLYVATLIQIQNDS